METLLVCEDSKPYMPHDQLFKQLIGTFFEEFLELFFPEVHHHLDFSSIKPLSDEVFTDLISGENRKADIVIEAKLKDQDTLIIIHVEPQSYRQPNFNERMYQYFSLLYNRYRKPILPIALFSYDGNRYEPDDFVISFPFFHVLTFHFLKVELRKLNWREYIESNNPVAAALLSKMNYSDKEKVQVKKEFLRMLVRMEINPAKMKLINGFFESYLTLNVREEKELSKEMKELFPIDQELLNKLPNSWRDKGLKEGKEEGIKEGKKEGEREATRNIAKEMLKEGLPVEMIVRLTNLTPSEIEELRK